MFKISLHLTTGHPFFKIWAYTIKSRAYDHKTERHFCLTIAGIWFSVSHYSK